MQLELEQNMEDEELIGVAGECEMKDNCIPQLKANMLAVAGGAWPIVLLTRILTKLQFMALDVFMRTRKLSTTS